MAASKWLAEIVLLCTRQVMHDDKGNTTVSYVEAVDVSRPERVQALLDKAMKQVWGQGGLWKLRKQIAWMSAEYAGMN